MNMRTALPTVPIALALVLAACGSSSSSDEAPAAGADTSTVSAMKVSGFGDVLVDAAGRAVYASDEESGGKVRCMGGCAAIWTPVLSTAKPTAGEGVSGKLALVSRGDGGSQVTLDGRPLYTFAEDPGAGEVTGNDLTDSFDGMKFRWHALTPAGAEVSRAAAPSSGYGNGNGY
jgi:predicted lipoprotein with Yx(FWY)xxD motif